MKGKRGPTPEAIEDNVPPNGTHPDVYQCGQCTFHTPHVPEMEEHLAGSGHEAYTTVTLEEPQAQLFTEPNPVRRLRVRYTPERIRELQAELAELFRQLVEQKELLQLAKEKAKEFEAAMLNVGKKLRDPFELQPVECEWQIVVEANMKTLLRTDTGEAVESVALTAEDRARELARVEEANRREARAR